MCAEVATTQWSQVLAARDGDDTEGREALEALCQTYWQPLYAYIRHQGSSPDEARDLTQGFFAEFLEKDFLSSVDPEKGRFRAFLLASLRNFLSHERDRERALKRGGGVTTLSLDVEAGEAGYASRPSTATTPEEVFERRWASTVLDRAMDRLEEDARASGDESRFVVLKRYLTSGTEQQPYSSLARELEMTEAAVGAAVSRLRKQFGRCLRAEVGEIVVNPAEVDDELRHLLAVVKDHPD
jgi:RNA polymerase sigma-70 factor (ECF subfamily)